MMGIWTSATAKRQVKSRRSPKLKLRGGGGGNVGREEVVVYPFFTPRRKLAWEHAEVRVGVDEECVLSSPVCNEKMAGTGIADVCHHQRLLV